MCTLNGNFFLCNFNLLFIFFTITFTRLNLWCLNTVRIIIIHILPAIHKASHIHIKHFVSLAFCISSTVSCRLIVDAVYAFSSFSHILLCVYANYSVFLHIKRIYQQKTLIVLRFTFIQGREKKYFTIIFIFHVNRKRIPDPSLAKKKKTKTKLKTNMKKGELSLKSMLNCAICKRYTRMKNGMVV